jgi:hypothetical protein
MGTINIDDVRQGKCDEIIRYSGRFACGRRSAMLFREEFDTGRLVYHGIKKVMMD